MTPTATFYTFNAPDHDHALYHAPRPLPGRLVGRSAGMVFDVAPEFVALALRDDAAQVHPITEAEFEALVEKALIDRGSYTRADYEAADAWNVRDMGRQFGFVVLTIDPA